MLLSWRHRISRKPSLREQTGSSTLSCLVPARARRGRSGESPVSTYVDGFDRCWSDCEPKNGRSERFTRSPGFTGESKALVCSSLRFVSAESLLPPAVFLFSTLVRRLSPALLFAFTTHARRAIPEKFAQGFLRSFRRAEGLESSGFEKRRVAASPCSICHCSERSEHENSAMRRGSFFCIE